MSSGFKEVELGSYFALLKSGLSRLLSQQDIGIPVLISGNIKNNRFDYSDLKYWYVRDPQGADTSKYLLDVGDILLCFINSIEQIGKLAIFKGYERPCIYTTNLFRIKAKSEIDSSFLYYLLSSRIVQDEIKAITKPAVNQASFTVGDFQKLKVPFVPLSQQRKIAQILSTVDAVLEKTEAAIAKYQQLKQGLMHDVFTRGIDVHTGQLRPKQTLAPELYKQSALGWIPKEWEVKKLEDFGEIKYGRDYKANPKGDKYPIYGTGGIMGWTSKSLNSGPAVLTGRKGTINNPIYVEGDFWNVDTIFCINTNESTNIKWFYYQMCSKDLMKLNEATGVPSVNSNALYNLKFSYPDKMEQDIITNKLNKIDQKIHTEQQALAKYQQLKAGLLQDLLTGRVEVSVN
ncbi:restriction endonuclease subunit S [Psychroserpens sp. XS_ASV72]|uniref:restriction endonuclease subunit S n=1 Tax=Psychroserpens sp. XS_ASV72 TaxID=3241293 RepID=UPI00351498D6